MTTGQALVAVRDYTFQFVPNISAALNALMIGTILYRFRLVPRIIPAKGFTPSHLSAATPSAAA